MNLTICGTVLLEFTYADFFPGSEAISDNGLCNIIRGYPNRCQGYEGNIVGAVVEGQPTGQTGQILDKVEDLGIGENTLVIYTVDNGAWQDVHPDAGMTPFRGTKGTDREGAYRVPFFAKWTGKIEPNSKSVSRKTSSGSGSGWIQSQW